MYSWSNSFHVMAKQPTLGDEHGLIKNHSLYRDDDKDGEYQGCVHHALSADDHGAQPFAGSNEFADNGADERQHNGDTNARQDDRQARGNFETP